MNGRDLVQTQIMRMSRHLLGLMLFIPLCFAAPDSDRKVQELLKQIAYNCAQITELKFPRPEQTIDREVQEFDDRVRWLERDLAALQKLDASARESTAVVVGKPFKAHLDGAYATIAKNRAELEKDRVSKPNSSALQEVDFAIVLARRGIVENESFDAMSQRYRMYQEGLKKAEAIDPRALETRRAQLAAVQPFLAKYEKAKTERDAATAKASQALADQDAAKKRIEAATEERMNAEAKKLGFKWAQVGLREVVQQMKEGDLTISEAKGVLVHHDPFDDFVVQNVVGAHAIYVCRGRRSGQVRIAVMKEKDRFYGEGAPLAEDKYAVVGISKFTSVLGSEQEILVFRRVP